MDAPYHLPCRRRAVFASPSVELARASGADGAYVYGDDEFIAARVLGLKDSKYHSECRDLPRWLLRRLGQMWIDAAVEEKAPSGHLWMRCLSKNEV